MILTTFSSIFLAAIPLAATSALDQAPQQQETTAQATAAEKKTKYRGSSYANESATVRTPEIENALYESRFTSRDTKLFKKLVGKWTK